MKGTPFWQIETEKGFFLVVGPNIVTPIFSTEEELDNYIKENHWDLISVLILTLIKYVKEKDSLDFLNNTDVTRQFSTEPQPIITPDGPRYDTDASGL